jgi:hypothetical protein
MPVRVSNEYIMMGGQAPIVLPDDHVSLAGAMALLALLMSLAGWSWNALVIS